ncbi:hypothetical protein [Spiroplasma endosymbiont of Nephrotoma flavescens]
MKSFAILFTCTYKYNSAKIFQKISKILLILKKMIKLNEKIILNN